MKLASTQRPCAGITLEQIRIARDIGADLRRTVADIAVDRRADLGVAEIEAGGFEIGLRLGDAGAGFGDLGIEHGQLLPGGGEPGAGGFGLRLRRFVVRCDVRSAFCLVP